MPSFYLGNNCPLQFLTMLLFLYWLFTQYKLLHQCFSVCLLFIRSFYTLILNPVAAFCSWSWSEFILSPSVSVVTSHCQGVSAIFILIGLQPLKLLLQHAYLLQQLLPVLLSSKLRLLLHLHDLSLVPTLQLSWHRLKETLSHLTGGKVLKPAWTQILPRFLSSEMNSSLF